MRTSLPRKLRLVSGLVLFAYVSTHLLNLALGLVSLPAMDAARPVFMGPWQTWPGLAVLYGAMAVHAALGLAALYQRTTLRLTRAEAMQVLMALALPPLLVLHVLGTRGVGMQVGFEPSYAWVMMIYWKWQPLAGLRQVLVLLTAWVHGCLGVYYWVRLQDGWPRWRGYVYPLALLVPVTALLGLVEAGKDVLELSTQRDWVSSLRANARMIDADAVDWVYRTEARFIGIYVLVVVLVLALRHLRVRRAGTRPYRIRYAHGPVIEGAPGLTLLDMSRAAEVAHTSLCGGKGRCGTCRVRVLEGRENLLPASALERETLNRLRSGDDIRLACQAIPRGSMKVERLLPAGALADRAEATWMLDGARRQVVVIGVRLDGFDAIARRTSVPAAARELTASLGWIEDALRGAGAFVDASDGRGVRAVLETDGAPAAAVRAALAAAGEIAAGAAHETRATVAIVLGEAFLAGPGGDARPLAFGGAMDEVEEALAHPAASGSRIFATPAAARFLPDDAAQVEVLEPRVPPGACAPGERVLEAAS